VFLRVFVVDQYDSKCPTHAPILARMNNNFTEIAFVLDRSGSMSVVHDSAIAGFNQFLREQQQTPGDARFTLALFDDQYEVPINRVPIIEVTELDSTTFVPRGSTALLDAIGKTIDNLGAQLAAMPEPQRPVKVIVAVLTDGLENSSHRYSWKDIAAKIRHQREQYQWEFLFLGANQDAIATAAQMNIAAMNAATFVSDAAGTVRSTRSLSRKMRAMRAMQSGFVNEQTATDLEKPLSQILEEENRKIR
jgi:von Willebrand factor type A domain